MDLKNRLDKLDNNMLNKIIKYYNISNIDNNNDRIHLIKLICNNLYLDKENNLKKNDYENRYLVLKGMILNGNDNIDIKNELNLF
jgi:hypothetical protein